MQPLFRLLKPTTSNFLDDLDERGRRRWAAVEVRALGRGGITPVALATGMSDHTIRTGIKEIDAAARRKKNENAGRLLRP